MRNQQIQTLALVLADLASISHVNSTMSFINMSGRNYVNVMIEDNTYTIDEDLVQVFEPPKQIPFKKFLSELMNVMEV